MVKNFHCKILGGIMKLKEASEIVKDNDMDILLYRKESHTLKMRLIDILNYSNLHDLRTINEALTEMGFGTKEDFV